MKITTLVIILLCDLFLLYLGITALVTNKLSFSEFIATEDEPLIFGAILTILGSYFAISIIQRIIKIKRKNTSRSKQE